jgi:hypothetical protein
MLAPTSLCQACRSKPAVETVENISEPPFLVCTACKERVSTYSLRPREWYNLALIHGPLSFYLHDDFYDEHGKALQPAAKVARAGDYPAPTLEQSTASLESLLEFCSTRFSLGPREHLALAQFPREELLAAVASRLDYPIAPQDKFMCFDIAVNVLQKSAADLFRKHFADMRVSSPSLWASAAVKCLPHDEAMGLISDVADTARDSKSLMDAAAALEHRRSPDSLEWIERTIGKPPSVLQFWGELAAKSHPTWPRLRGWIAQGRPLSLVALDAMWAIARLRDTKSHFNDAILAKVDDRDEVVAALRAYGAKDTVPRVTRDVKAIIENIDSICE